MRGLVVLALLGGLGLCGCVSLRERRETELASARAAASASPGAPREALAYANALAANLSEEDPDRRAVVAEGEIARAIENLETAAERAPEEKPLLLERQGFLWLLAKDLDRAEESYRASVRARPSANALSALMRIAGKRGNLEQVRMLCVEGAPALADAELVAHVETCADAAHATSPKIASAWLKDADRQRLQRFSDAALQGEIDADNARRDLEKRVDVCIADCKERGHACLSRCDNRDLCPPACEGQYQACLERCDAELR